MGAKTPTMPGTAPRQFDPASSGGSHLGYTPMSTGTGVTPMPSQPAYPSQPASNPHQFSTDVMPYSPTAAPAPTPFSTSPYASPNGGFSPAVTGGPMQQAGACPTCGK